jgi:hypothetical protein
MRGTVVVSCEKGEKLKISLRLVEIYTYLKQVDNLIVASLVRFHFIICLPY